MCSDLDFKRSLSLLCDKQIFGKSSPSRSKETNKKAFKIAQTGNNCGLKVSNHSEDPNKIEYALKLK